MKAACWMFNGLLCCVDLGFYLFSLAKSVLTRFSVERLSVIFMLVLTFNAASREGFVDNQPVHQVGSAADKHRKGLFITNNQNDDAIETHDGKTGGNHDLEHDVPTNETEPHKKKKEDLPVDIPGMLGVTELLKQFKENEGKDQGYFGSSGGGGSDYFDKPHGKPGPPDINPFMLLLLQQQQQMQALKQNQMAEIINSLAGVMGIDAFRTYVNGLWLSMTGPRDSGWWGTYIDETRDRFWAQLASLYTWFFPDDEAVAKKLTAGEYEIVHETNQSGELNSFIHLLYENNNADNARPSNIPVVLSFWDSEKKQYVDIPEEVLSLIREGCTDDYLSVLATMIKMAIVWKPMLKGVNSVKTSPDQLLDYRNIWRGIALSEAESRTSEKGFEEENASQSVYSTSLEAFLDSRMAIKVGDDDDSFYLALSLMLYGTASHDNVAMVKKELDRYLNERSDDDTDDSQTCLALDQESFWNGNEQSENPSLQVIASNLLFNPARGHSQLIPLVANAFHRTILFVVGGESGELSVHQVNPDGTMHERTIDTITSDDDVLFQYDELHWGYAPTPGYEPVMYGMSVPNSPVVAGETSNNHENTANTVSIRLKYRPDRNNNEERDDGTADRQGGSGGDSPDDALSYQSWLSSDRLAVIRELDKHLAEHILKLAGLVRSPEQQGYIERLIDRIEMLINYHKNSPDQNVADQSATELVYQLMSIELNIKRTISIFMNADYASMLNSHDKDTLLKLLSVQMDLMEHAPSTLIESLFVYIHKKIKTKTESAAANFLSEDNVETDDNKVGQYDTLNLTNKKESSIDIVDIDDAYTLLKRWIDLVFVRGGENSGFILKSDSMFRGRRSNTPDLLSTLDDAQRALDSNQEVVRFVDGLSVSMRRISMTLDDSLIAMRRQYLESILSSSEQDYYDVIGFSESMMLLTLLDKVSMVDLGQSSRQFALMDRLINEMKVELEAVNKLVADQLPSINSLNTESSEKSNALMFDLMARDKTIDYYLDTIKPIAGVYFSVDAKKLLILPYCLALSKSSENDIVRYLKTLVSGEQEDNVAPFIGNVLHSEGLSSQLWSLENLAYNYESLSHAVKKIIRLIGLSRWLNDEFQQYEVLSGKSKFLKSMGNVNKDKIKRKFEKNVFLPVVGESEANFNTLNKVISGFSGIYHSVLSDELAKAPEYLKSYESEPENDHSDNLKSPYYKDILTFLLYSRAYKHRMARSRHASPDSGQLYLKRELKKASAAGSFMVNTAKKVFSVPELFFSKLDSESLGSEDGSRLGQFKSWAKKVVRKMPMYPSEEVDVTKMKLSHISPNIWREGGWLYGNNYLHDSSATHDKDGHVRERLPYMDSALNSVENLTNWYRLILISLKQARYTFKKHYQSYSVSSNVLKEVDRQILRIDKMIQQKLSETPEKDSFLFDIVARLADATSSGESRINSVKDQLNKQLKAFYKSKLSVMLSKENTQPAPDENVIALEELSPTTGSGKFVALFYKAMLASIFHDPFISNVSADSNSVSLLAQFSTLLSTGVNINTGSYKDLRKFDQLVEIDEMAIDQIDQFYVRLASEHKQKIEMLAAEKIYETSKNNLELQPDHVFFLEHMLYKEYSKFFVHLEKYWMNQRKSGVDPEKIQRLSVTEFLTMTVRDIDTVLSTLKRQLKKMKRVNAATSATEMVIGNDLASENNLLLKEPVTEQPVKSDTTIKELEETIQIGGLLKGFFSMLKVVKDYENKKGTRWEKKAHESAVASVTEFAERNEGAISFSYFVATLTSIYYRTWGKKGPVAFTFDSGAPVSFAATQVGQSFAIDTALAVVSLYSIVAQLTQAAGWMNDIRKKKAAIQDSLYLPFAASDLSTIDKSDLVKYFLNSIRYGQPKTLHEGMDQNPYRMGSHPADTAWDLLSFFCCKKSPVNDEIRKGTHEFKEEVKDCVGEACRPVGQCASNCWGNAKEKAEQVEENYSGSCCRAGSCIEHQCGSVGQCFIACCGLVGSCGSCCCSKHTAKLSKKKTHLDKLENQGNPYCSYCCGLLPSTFGFSHVATDRVRGGIDRDTANVVHKLEGREKATKARLVIENPAKAANNMWGPSVAQIITAAVVHLIDYPIADKEIDAFGDMVMADNALFAKSYAVDSLFDHGSLTPTQHDLLNDMFGSATASDMTLPDPDRAAEATNIAYLALLWGAANVVNAGAGNAAYMELWDIVIKPLLFNEGLVNGLCDAKKAVKMPHIGTLGADGKKIPYSKERDLECYLAKFADGRKAAAWRRFFDVFTNKIGKKYASLLMVMFYNKSLGKKSVDPMIVGSLFAAFAKNGFLGPFERWCQAGTSIGRLTIGDLVNAINTWIKEAIESAIQRLAPKAPASVYRTAQSYYEQAYEASGGDPGKTIMSLVALLDHLSRNVGFQAMQDAASIRREMFYSHLEPNVDTLNTKGSVLDFAKDVRGQLVESLPSANPDNLKKLKDDPEFMAELNRFTMAAEMFEVNLDMGMPIIKAASAFRKMMPSDPRVFDAFLESRLRPDSLKGRSLPVHSRKPKDHWSNVKKLYSSARDARVTGTE